MTGSAPSQALKTLDGYFSSHVAERGDKPALADPVNRQLFTSGAARTLTFAEMDGAVSRLASHFASLGLKPLDVVMVQLPNTIEMPITLLALSRAGLIAAPVPVAWGLHEVKKAGAAIRPRAIITCGYVGKQQLADRMRFAAFDTPSVRFVFSYGIDLPDGVIPLEDVLNASDTPEARPGFTVKPEHLALISFEESREGVQPLGRSHVQLGHAASQLSTLMELSSDSIVLSPYLMSSLTGLSCLHTWLKSGCKLVLHHPFSSAAFGMQMEKEAPSHIFLPASVAATETITPLLSWPSLTHAVLGWPQRKLNIYPRSSGKIINIMSLGELALSASIAKEPGAPKLPLGPMHSVIDGEKVTLLETRLKGESRKGADIATAGTALEARLQVRGAALPNVLGRETPEDGYYETGLLARPVAAMPPAAEVVGQTELLAVGGLRFDGRELEKAYTEHEAVARARAYNETDGLLGARLAATIQPATGEYVNPEDLGDVLQSLDMASYKIPHRVTAVAKIETPEVDESDANAASLLGALKAS